MAFFNDRSSVYGYGADSPSPALTSVLSRTPDRAGRPGSTKYSTVSGLTATLQGHVPGANNNPGDIEAGPFTRSVGALPGNSGRFAAFADKESGLKAIGSLLGTKSYQNLSVAQAISRWAPPNENNTANYIAQVAAALGVDPNTTKVKDLDASGISTMSNAIAGVEGYKAPQVAYSGDYNYADPGAFPAGPEPIAEDNTPVGRMWSSVQSVLGAPVTAAMKAGNISIGIGMSLADQASKIASVSAQTQNAPVDSPANRMRSAVGLPAHPASTTPDTAYSQAAPVGQVQRGPDLAAPAARMHEAISQQYGGPTAAADAAKAQGISYSAPAHPATPTPATARAPTAAQVSTSLADAQALNGATPAPGTVGPGKPGELGTPVQAAQAPAVNTPLGMDTTAPTAIADNRPDSLSFDSSMLSQAPTLASMAAPAPVAPPVAAPVVAPKPVQSRPVPAPKPVQVAAPKPRTIQSVQPAIAPPAPPLGLQTAVTKARPGTSLFDAISQNNLGAAPQGTRWGVGITGKPVAVPTSAPEGVQIAASGTGLLGALGLTSPQQTSQQPQSGGFFGNLANTIGGWLGGSNSGGGYTATGLGSQLQANAANLSSLVAANPYLSGGGGGISMSGGYRTSNEGGNLHG